MHSTAAKRTAAEAQAGAGRETEEGRRTAGNRTLQRNDTINRIHEDETRGSAAYQNVRWSDRHPDACVDGYGACSMRKIENE